MNYLQKISAWTRKLLLIPSIDLSNIHRLSFNGYSTMADDQFLDIDGQNICYKIVGDGPRNILCLPGALGSWRTDFKPQLEGDHCLAVPGFKVIFWDPPGYGMSRPPARKFDLQFFHNDANTARKMMQHLNLLPYSVLGWSDGGITALCMAHQARHSDQEIDKLVIWGANSYIDESDVKIYKSIRDISNWSERMRQPFIDMYGEEYFKNTWEQWVDTICSFHTEKSGNICDEVLKDIGNETLIVHGAKDPVVPCHHPEHLAKSIPNSGPVVYHAEGKHNVHLRYPQWFRDVVLQFLQSQKTEHKL